MHYYIVRKEKRIGPFSKEQLKEMLSTGMISRDDLACSEGLSEYGPVHYIVEEPQGSQLLQLFSMNKAKAETPPEIISVHPYGIGGWLLLFCIILTIYLPGYSLVTLPKAWKSFRPYFANFPALKNAVILMFAGGIAFVIYALVIGTLIWSRNKKGEKLAKQYLLIRLFGSLIVEWATVLLVASQQAEVFRAFSSTAVKFSLYEVVFFLIWWFYFKKSKRIRLTYRLTELLDKAKATDDVRV